MSPQGVGATGTAALLNVPKSLEQLLLRLQVCAGGGAGRVCVCMGARRYVGEGGRGGRYVLRGAPPVTDLKPM